MQTNNYPKAIFQLKPSLVSKGQVGLFSLKKFEKEEIIVSNDYWDETVLITWEEYEKLDQSTKESLDNFCYKTEEGIYGPKNINKINIAYFFNHSCDPNSYHDGDGNYIANKDIESNTEFTIDIESLNKKTTKVFECSCGASNCRKIIKV
jgi:SET domain-containing protein